MEPTILFEDQDILVINKPAGMTINRSETTVGETTVQDWIEKTFHLVSQHPDDTDFYKRAGIVHRLDKETSGILLAAKTPEAFTDLQSQFKERKVKKTYLALVHGVMLPEVGEISVPVGRLSWNRKRFGVIAGGREAVTKYKTISHFKTSIVHKQEDVTLVEFYPETGRTHQIRVHAKYFGHPIFSDFLYAGRKTARTDRKFLPRVFLHAHKITFFHPNTHTVISLKSPLPEDLTQFLQSFG